MLADFFADNREKAGRLTRRNIDDLVRQLHNSADEAALLEAAVVPAMQRMPEGNAIRMVQLGENVQAVDFSRGRGPRPDTRGGVA
jgi:hypothetical protein